MARSHTRELLHAVAGRNPDRQRDHIVTAYGVVLLTITFIAVFLQGVTMTVQPRVQSFAMMIPALTCSFAGLLWTSAALGPFALAPPVARWFGLSPLPRAELVIQRARRALAVIIVLGAMLGVVTGLLSAPGWVSPLTGAICGMSLGIIAYVVAAKAQSRRRTNTVRNSVALVTVMGLLGLALASRRPGQLPVDPGWFTAAVVLAAALAVSALLVLATCWPVIPRWADATSYAALRATGEQTAAWSDAAISLDVDGVNARRELAHARARGAWPSQRLTHTSFVTTLLLRDMTFVRRNAWAIAVRGLGCLAAAAIAQIFGLTVAVVWLGLACLVLAAFLTSRLQAWLGSTALWRAFPQRPRRVSCALSVMPLLILTATGALSGALSGDVWAGLALGLAALAPSLRRHNRPVMTPGETLDTPFGQVPLGILMSLTYGFETVGSTALTGFFTSWPLALWVALTWLLRSLWSAWPSGSQPPRRRWFRAPTLIQRLWAPK